MVAESAGRTSFIAAAALYLLNQWLTSYSSGLKLAQKALL
ncbi:hypothetical protein C4K27_4891 [Pseudomonas chlororaphis subsp. chlororaphis]|nr:hypothetical protein C4K27_4891 [Pseudomonas chlororaphis subsp. chlororaphis]